MARQLCPTRDSLSGYVLGTLPDTLASTVATHLEDCPPCQAAVAEMETQSESITLLQRPAPRKGVPTPPKQPLRSQQEVPLQAPQEVKLAAPPSSTSSASVVTSSDADSVALPVFIARLTTAGVLTAAEVNAVVAALPAQQRPTDGRTLAAALIAAGKLTKFQERRTFIRIKRRG